MLLIVAGAAIGTYERFGPIISARMKSVYWQHRCMGHEVPEDMIVYEYSDDASRINTLLKQRTGCGKVFNYPTAMIYCAPEWSQYRRWGLDDGIASPGDGTVFLHARRNGKGQERLVVVILRPAGPLSGTGNMYIEAYAITPGTLLAAPAFRPWPLPDESTILVFLDARISAGRSDPLDASHFTFHILREDMDGGKPDRIVDGWLRDDDVVELKVQEASTPGNTP
ncbi:MAG TPA: hypothetical protein VG269_10390 [Tepidisphaeraceae bacterium]|jgi:hypothetical protein|nr:hypothetical protein [Tepidisphaeraceae bacterium]